MVIKLMLQVKMKTKSSKTNKYLKITNIFRNIAVTKSRKNWLKQKHLLRLNYSSLERDFELYVQRLRYKLTKKR